MYMQKLIEVRLDYKNIKLYQNNCVECLELCDETNYDSI